MSNDNLLTIDENKYYDTIQELFATEGWKLFIEDMEANLNQARNAAPNDCITNDQWQYRRGMLQGLNYAYKWADIMEMQKDALVEGRLLDKEEE